MANSITFVEGQAGLGAPLPGQDYVSGYAHYTTQTVPVGFSASNIQEVFSISDLETLGVTQSNTEYGIMWYHVNEFFRVQPQGALYVGVFATAGSYDDLETLQSYADGSIRQIGIYESATFSASTLFTLQNKANELSFTNYTPCEIFWQPNFKGLTLSTLPDLNNYDAQNVTVCLGQDGGANGLALYNAVNKTVGCVGTFLGSVALSAVQESVAWPDKFNVDSGTEFDTLAFSNGQLYKNQTTGLINQLDNRRYVFPKKLIGLNGSYWNNPYTAISSSSDYCFVFRNRVIHKAERNIRTMMTPQLARNIYFNADGSINYGTIKYWESLCSQQLSSMVSSGEISAYKVIIDPVQNVLSTNTLTISLQIVPVGVANNITINIGFVTSV